MPKSLNRQLRGERHPLHQRLFFHIDRHRPHRRRLPRRPNHIIHRLFPPSNKQTTSQALIPGATTTLMRSPRRAIGKLAGM
jgi:hypothetical protein